MLLPSCDVCRRIFTSKRRLVSHLQAFPDCRARSVVAVRMSEQKERDRARRTFACALCEKRFPRKAELNRHHRIKHGDQQQQQQQQQQTPPLSTDGATLAELQGQIRELSQKIDRLPSSAPIIGNNSGNYNFHQQNHHVHINGLGKEDLSRVTSDVLTNCLKELPKGNRGILNLINLIHYETGHNSNVKPVDGDQSNLVLSYYDDVQGRWLIDDKNKVMHRMIHGPRSMLNDHFSSNMGHFEAELTSALYNFIHFWFRDTRNKRSATYGDVTHRLQELIRRAQRRVMEDMHMEGEDVQDAGGRDLKRKERPSESRTEEGDDDDDVDDDSDE